MAGRPKLKIELTAWDKAIEIMSWMTLAILWALTLFNYATLPGKIPIHFNGSGQADSYGSKGAIFTLPIVGTVLFMGLTILNKVPHIFNYLANITADNAFRQYTMATRLVRYLKFAVVLIFSLIVFNTSQAATGKSEGLGLWFLPFTLGLFFIPLAWFIIKSLRAK